VKTLNIIGPGRVARALARMWVEAGVFGVHDVLARSRASAGEAVTFIGSGTAAGSLAGMRAADVWMIATRDDAISPCCTALAGSGRLAPGAIVFHVSGATPSSELEPARARGAQVASVHPIKTFTDAALAVRTFPGTYCAAEGDAAALALLKPAFERIGAKLFDIAPGLKRVYHAAGVFSCNYLAALIEQALRAHECAGIPRSISLAALEPMVRETVDAVFGRGPARALTGPISRGDVSTVGRQLAALERWDRTAAELYRGLGLLAVELAQSDGRIDAAGVADLRRTLAART
jgi:predicted short-subunit dehydrogenase-like oxidoreductase (DUF2520 family)